jgi:hypothetical protein
MAASRNSDSSRRTPRPSSKRPTKTWTPAKFQGEASELIKSPPTDPWKDCHQPWVTPEWKDPRQFWSTVLAYLHWRENGRMPQTHYDRPDHAKSFWDAIQSCELMEPIWNHQPVEDVHVFILALNTIHWRELNSRTSTPIEPKLTPGVIRKRERREWATWVHWFQETAAGIQNIPGQLLSAEECASILEIIGRAKSQAAVWSKTPPAREIHVHIYGSLPDGSWGIRKTLKMKDSRAPAPGRPAEGDLPNAISGELASLDTFARPVFGKRGYPKSFAAIVRHFLPSLNSSAASLEEVLRVRIHKVRQTRSEYVARLESGINSALQTLKADPLQSELS